METDRSLIGREFVHFKGGHYRLVGYAKDSETLEPMCVYEALYGDPPSPDGSGVTSGGLWVRQQPERSGDSTRRRRSRRAAKMFFENVEKPGCSGPRFKLVDEVK